MALYDALSRYHLDANGQSASRNTPAKRGYVAYVVVQGDTLENLATKYLGNPRRFWEIADMNPQVKFPLDLEVGQLLRMPT